MKRDYSRDLFKHVEELTIENERLRAENSKLRAENTKLRSENARLTARVAELESTMEARIAQAVEKAVAEATAPLLEKIDRQQKEISRLKAQLAKDSSNSSKPPSSNGFKKVLNNREKSCLTHGGQKGHQGHTLQIPDNLQELAALGRVEHKIIDLTNGAADYVADFIIDVKLVTIYTEIRRSGGNPPQISYGNNLQVLVVYLSVSGLISIKRLSEFFREVTHGFVTISKATIMKFNHNIANSVNLEPLERDLLNGEVIHVDETPVKTTERVEQDKAEIAEHTTFNAYIRVYANATATLLTGSAHKDKGSLESDDILPRFHGIVSQDHEAKFYQYGDSHATCHAHLNRELKGLESNYKIELAGEIRKFFQEMNDNKNKDLREGVTECEESLLSEYESRYDEFISRGEEQLKKMPKEEFGYEELRRMINRLREYKGSYMLFMRNYIAPYTNNQAERDLRHCKTKQKIGGCFRSWQGLLDYCKISSFIMTAKKREESIFDALSSLLPTPLPAGQ